MKEFRAKEVHRLLCLAVGMLVLFCFILFQFYTLQMIEGEKWEKLAKAQHHLFLTEPYRRGRFILTQALKEKHPQAIVPLVFDVKKFHLYIDPLSMSQTLKEPIYLNIVQTLSLSPTEKKRVWEQFQKKSRRRRLKMWVDEKEKISLLNWWTSFAKLHKISSNALYFEEDYQRVYPYGTLLGNVLHTIREDRDPDNQKAVPTGGLEWVFDSYLQGTPGKRLLLRSPGKTLEEGILLSYPEDGADVHLTIDLYIQAIVEEEIERAVKRFGAKSGWAVMMNPQNGEIYALAQYPFFDPSNYRKYYNHPDLLSATKVRAITDAFEPGSTMKPISIAIALLANQELKRRGKAPIFDPNEMVSVSDGTFPGRKTPIRDVGIYRHLNMHLAMQKSSNIYVAKMIQKVVDTLGKEWYRKQLEEVFGFGTSTGIELPSESPGFLPDFAKTYDNGMLQWSTPTPYSLSFGYNLLTNTMQILRAYAILINGGRSIKPTLVRKIVQDNRILFEPSFKESKPLFDSTISRQIIDALKCVTKPGGGSVRADIPGYTEGGKSGTTEKIVRGGYSSRQHYSSFVGFTPTSHPKFLVYIAMDEPDYRYLPGIGKVFFGGRCAAPVFRQIMQKTYQYLGIPPDDPHGFSIGHPQADPEKADWNKQTTSLSELYRKWNG